MAEAIATIKLAPGVVGIFDPLTRIHLMISKPTAIVYSGMNTKNIAYWVKTKKVSLISGTLTGKLEVKAPVIQAAPADEKPVAPAEPPAAPVEDEKPSEEIPEVPLKSEAPAADAGEDEASDAPADEKPADEPAAPAEDAAEDAEEKADKPAPSKRNKNRKDK